VDFAKKKTKNNTYSSVRYTQNILMQ